MHNMAELGVRNAEVNDPGMADAPGGELSIDAVVRDRRS